MSAKITSIVKCLVKYAAHILVHYFILCVC